MCIRGVFSMKSGVTRRNYTKLIEQILMLIISLGLIDIAVLIVELL